VFRRDLDRKGADKPETSGREISEGLYDQQRAQEIVEGPAEDYLHERGGAP
jgi:hypothetical protein